MNNDKILTLVRQSLDDFDDRPLEVALRQVVRIATLLGDTHTAVRFMLDARPSSGSKHANGDDIKKLMMDQSLWETHEGPHRTAIEEYIDDRSYNNGKIQTHSITELEDIVKAMDMADPDRSGSANYQQQRSFLRDLLQRSRMRAFVTLCSWERQLTYSNTNEYIFSRFKSGVDMLLSARAPDIIDSFNAIYRRLRDARLDDKAAKEELSQAVTTCRRILKAVADHVYPPSSELSADGQKLDDAKYRNRIKEFIKTQIQSKSVRNATYANVDGLYDRFEALDTYTNKGVHASVAVEEAEACAINTYIVAGEILKLSAGDKE